MLDFNSFMSLTVHTTDLIHVMIYGNHMQQMPRGKLRSIRARLPVLNEKGLFLCNISTPKQHVFTPPLASQPTLSFTSFVTVWTYNALKHLETIQTLTDIMFI